MKPGLSRIAIATVLTFALAPLASAETYEFRTVMKGVQAAAPEAPCVNADDIPLQARQLRSDICGFVGHELYQSLDGLWFKASEDMLSTQEEVLAACVTPFGLPRQYEAINILRTKGTRYRTAWSGTAEVLRGIEWTGGTSGYRQWSPRATSRYYQYCKAVF